ncbi:SDR family NAD(P)-dependent oxidoreductase [Leucobacter luti]|uniref:Ketoreductase RED2 n=1 Tax=Leucobacter luti TaxID=340320 RepID=A0A4Q7U7P3_9MICO|nr:SDR family oxidoreductase [Leucobacter luti]MBL3700707.1 SDR family oxidoreductase [Leucobacter luti]RZT68452.1 ketoreductase RED2 [Leucobacter luti]
MPHAQPDPAPVAIVTGATGGIGRAIARRLAARGFRIVAHGCGTQEAGDALCAELGDARYVEADLSDPAQAAELAEAARAAFGRIDVVINNAGIGIPVPHADLAAVTPDFFTRMLSVNLAGPWYLVQACASDLAAARGSVINMTSLAASTVSGSSIPYAVSKAGLEHLTRLLAVALGPEVRVNAIAPGLVDTERTLGWDQIRDRVIETSPLRRSGTPEDIAAACLALLDTDYVTGAILPVDGGQRLI